jgi:hypothetical protein
MSSAAPPDAHASNPPTVQHRFLAGTGGGVAQRSMPMARSSRVYRQQGEVGQSIFLESAGGPPS